MPALCPQCGKETTQGGRFCPFCGAGLTAAAAAHSGDTLQMGALFAGKFRIERELGRGAFGIVYQAHDTMLDRPVAIKTIRSDGFSSPGEREEFEKRFLREARSVAKLHHPNVIAVFEAGQEDRVSYIVMELVRGSTLRTLLDERRKLSVAETLPIARGLLGALAAAHAQGVIHRDVKPENVMIAETGAIKVTDFGIAKASHAGAVTLTRDGAILGTPSYMSPEQVVGKEIDGRSDLFSAGVLLYETLAGRRPFENERLPSLIHAIMHKDPAPPRSLEPSIPEEWSAVLLRALAKDPADRYATASDMARTLVNELGTEALVLPVLPPPAPERAVAAQAPTKVIGASESTRAPAPAARTNRVPFVAVAAAGGLFLLLLVAAIVVVAIVRRGPSLLPGGRTTLPGRGPAGDRQAVAGVIYAFDAAVSRGDLERVMAMLAPSAEVATPSGVVKGQAELRAFYGAAFRARAPGAVVRIESKIRSMDVNGARAIVLGKDKMSVNGKKTGGGGFSVELQKIGSAWLVARIG